MTDVIDMLAGLPSDADLRAARPTAREYAQKSHEALFVTVRDGLMPVGERLAVACFVAGLHGDAPAMEMYAGLLADSDTAGLSDAIAAAVKAGRTEGPYGAFPEGPLSVEDTPGMTFTADADALGARLAAAFDHAHLLVFHPRDAGRDAIVALTEAGWNATDIVTLSQLISFLSFQIRAGAGLRVLAATR
ncbi:MAG: CMD domain protein [Maritimibacter sp.]|nr:CMD domain protein [Maritimibacter sp.]